jgi:inositol transport system substrate-binding protein
MTTLSRALAVGAAGFLLAGSLAACSRGGAGAGQSVGVSFSNLSTPYQVTMRRDLEDEAKKLGVTVNVVDAQGNSAKQTSDLQTFAVQGVGGVVVAANDSTALAPAVEALMDQKTPVVAVDRTVESKTHPVPYVGADNEAGGRLLGGWVVQNYPNGAAVVLITNEPGQSSAIERTKGVHESLAAAGAKYRIVAEQTANSSRAQALTVAQNILTAQAGRRPDVIICLNDDMALGALEALKTAGLDKSGIKVLGFDAIPEALAQIRGGAMAATVEQSPARQIRTALDEVVQAMKDHRPPKSERIAPALITAANLSQAERFGELK